MHSHHHGHAGSHEPHSHDGAFKVGIVLNGLFVLAEAGFGIRYDSVALISDASHNLSDVFALLLAWGGSVLGRAPARGRHTYGYRRATIIASVLSGVALFVALGAVIWEALGRLQTPVATDATVVIAVAALGVVINAATAALFLRGRHGDLNVKAAYLHMAADAAVSLGVVVAGLVIYWKGWDWVDPAVALVVAAIILVSGFDLLREGMELALDAAPRHIDIDALSKFLATYPRVTGVHHLHVWAMSTTETALTVHLVVPDVLSHDELLKELAAALGSQFGIAHPTIQLERGSTSGECICVDVVHSA